MDIKVASRIDRLPTYILGLATLVDELLELAEEDRKSVV